MTVAAPDVVLIVEAAPRAVTTARSRTGQSSEVHLPIQDSAALLRHLHGRPLLVAVSVHLQEVVAVALLLRVEAAAAQAALPPEVVEPHDSCKSSFNQKLNNH